MNYNSTIYVKIDDITTNYEIFSIEDLEIISSEIKLLTSSKPLMSPPTKVVEDLFSKIFSV